MTAASSIHDLDPGKSFAEFFAGIGLMRMGLERRGWRVAYANDIDAEKKAMYCGHFRGSDGRYVCGDIHNLDAADVPAVALATASFPCADLSLAGGRTGLGGEQSSAFWGFVRVLGEMGEKRPPLVLLENVTGFLTSRGGEDLRDALVALNALGYGMDAFVVDAARFVPQSRSRLFLVGVRDARGDTLGVTDGKDCLESELRPKALADFIAANPGIEWRIRDLPALPRREGGLDSILEDVPKDSKAWWSEERAGYLLNQMSAKHRAAADAMIAGRRRSFGTVFRRVRKGKCMAELRTDGTAGCLRTPKGGSAKQILFAAGGGGFRVRLLTARECARLMGADDFRVTAPLSKALFGFGDAVCVPAVAWIAEHYLDPVLDEMVRENAAVAAM